ncbi:MAG: MBL fold metallo-hydrolase [Gemmatimonadaceae bacterium]|nr:MBL fold metallo-hydrolase [Gemmatimonadaceae bacterium]
MHIQFAGAAREVTGSCHILHVGGRRILLDCGLFQGRRAESREKNERLPLAPDAVDAVLLSHAHIDHAGRLPYLVRQGYTGSIWATSATRDLCAVMLADSANIQTRDAEFLARQGRPVLEPLYGLPDAVQAVDQMIGVPYDRWVDVLPGVRAQFTDAGHILGSASIVIEAIEGNRTHRVIFSGDIGRSGLPIIRDPAPPSGGADTVLLESTYGNRDHETVADAKAHLGRVVRETAKRGGRVLVPAFALGRTQELVYDLHELWREGEIPEIPIVIDSPLALDATSVFKLHANVFDRSELLIQETADPLAFPLVRFTRSVEESKQLNTRHGPMVLIAASGMAESGRILHHLRHGASDPRNTVLIVGFNAQHTLGRRIVERQPMLRIYGDEVPLVASVEVLNGYSAHGDHTELKAWLDAVRAGGVKARREIQRVHLVHGEPASQDAFAQELSAAGYVVDAPEPDETRPVL